VLIVFEPTLDDARRGRDQTDATAVIAVSEVRG
jgi:hypothetical protein